MSSNTIESLLERLNSHKKELSPVCITSLFEQNPDRFSDMSCSAAGITLDYSKNIATSETLGLLMALAREHRLEQRIQAMMNGEQINATEQRQVLHVALRASEGVTAQYRSLVDDVLKKMEDFVARIHGGQWQGYSGKAITDIVNIGIGGSDLGPLMATTALKPYHQKAVNCHFVSNVDAADISEVLSVLNPETTLFIVASKTFTTIETLTNAKTARAWLLKSISEQPNRDQDAAIAKHFVAVTANTDNAKAFGIAEHNVFPMWDWVGGRYSMWSAIGMPIALAIGMEGFHQLRAGAAAMDEHFRNAPLENNLPVLMGMFGVWYSQYWDAHSHAVLPYCHYLSQFPKYLQQLDMESNGKSASICGGFVSEHTGSVIWGDVGTNGQHSFHQLLHQGTRFIPADFIMPLTAHHDVDDHHSLLFANCLSQSRALMQGKSAEQAKQEFMAMGYSEQEAQYLAPHKQMPGNRPSNTLVIDKLDPYSLGALVALYEHKVYVQSIVWEINAFDQWGVELGKKLCSEIVNVINGEQGEEAFDASTQALIAMFKKKNK